MRMDGRIKSHILGILRDGLKDLNDQIENAEQLPEFPKDKRSIFASKQVMVQCLENVRNLYQEDIDYLEKMSDA